MNLSFSDWVCLNTIVDLACVVFIFAMVWKTKRQSKINKDLLRNLEEKEIEILQIHQDLDEIRDINLATRSDLNVVMRNPQAAKRLLKERQQ
jgi:hypothetical protein